MSLKSAYLTGTYVLTNFFSYDLLLHTIKVKHKHYQNNLGYFAISTPRKIDEIKVSNETTSIKGVIPTRK